MFLNDIVDAMSIAEAKRTQAQRNREHCRTGWHKEGSKASPTYGKEVEVNNCVKNESAAEGEHDAEFIDHEDSFYNMANFAHEQMRQGKLLQDVVKYLVDNNYLEGRQVSTFVKQVRGEKWNEGVDDTVTFGVDSEKAYNHIMTKFGKAITWRGDDMVAPRKYWAAIQQLAHDAGGATEETGYERDVAETTGDKPFDNMMKTIKTGTKKQATADRRKQKKQDQERTRTAISNMFGSSMDQLKNLKIKEQGVAEGLEQTPDQVRQTLNAWMERDQQYTDPTQRAGDQAKVWPYIQQNIKTILADKGEDGKGSYPAAPYAAWLLVQHMDAYPQNQIEFYNALKQAIPNHPKIQFLRDRAAVNQWILQNANNPKYYYNSEPLPNPTVNVRNPAMFKDAGIVATSRKEALKNAINAGNKLLVAAVRATKAKTQPSYKQGVEEGWKGKLAGAALAGAVGAGAMGYHDATPDIEYKGYTFQHAPLNVKVPGSAHYVKLDGKEYLMWKSNKPALPGNPEFLYKLKSEGDAENLAGLEEDSWHGEGDAWHGQGQVMEYADAHMVPNDSASAIPGTSELDENTPSRQSLIDLLKDQVDVSHLELLTYDELLKVCEHYGIELNEYNSADPAMGPSPDDSQSPIHEMTQQERRLVALYLAEMKRAGYFE